ncbi:hypothetical protein yc1106_09957 [Curvularia clavata]|uniref:Uncharacterized protein n=1 Tax=Curvularia clavata TaxID=95742 RepID=A0A9Q8ZMD1_CURCL|nr:hypothetical protein yc1106_09957 [Curvularia clavata]
MVDTSSKITTTSTSNGFGPHEPVTDSHCLGSKENTRVGFRLGKMSDDNDDNDNDDETKGAQAFDRISWMARAKGYSVRAPNKRLRRVRALPNPPVQSTGVTKRRLIYEDATSTADTQEEDDIAVAIALSLKDIPACLPDSQTESQQGLHPPDVMEIEPTAFTPSRRPRKPTGQARSYRNLGSSSASTAAAPHEALHDLLRIMDASIKTLDGYAHEGIEVDAQELVDHVSRWQGRIRQVIHASELSEQRRIRDLKAQLDFDQHVEEVHRNNIKKLNQSWTETMHEQEKEWQKESNKLQVIGARPQSNESNESLAQLYATDMHPTQGGVPFIRRAMAEACGVGAIQDYPSARSFNPVSNMRRLPDQPTAEEVRVYAGLTEREWDVFTAIITEEARALRKENPFTPWKDLDQKRKEQVHDSVNAKLAKKSIQPVDLEVVATRASRSLSRMKHEGTSQRKAQAAEQNAPSNTATATATTSAERSRPYDPVRDL